MLGKIWIALALVLAIGGEGVANAAPTGPGGALHGCVGKHGLLRIVGAHAKCDRGQQSITFGEHGPTGRRGPRGRPADSGDIKTLKSEVSALQGQVGALEGENTSLTNEVDGLNTTLAGVTRDGTTLRLSGMNLQLQSGAGSTSATPNGLGNLIVGYNQNPGVQTGRAM